MTRLIFAIIAAAAWTILCALIVPPPAHSHEWFLNKKNPSTGIGCCESQHCHEIEDIDWWRKDNVYYVRWRNGIIYAIPAGQAQPSESETGKAGACVYNDRLVCIFIPLSY